MSAPSYIPRHAPSPRASAPDVAGCDRLSQAEASGFHASTTSSCDSAALVLVLAGLCDSVRLRASPGPARYSPPCSTRRVSCPSPTSTTSIWLTSSRVGLSPHLGPWFAGSLESWLAAHDGCVSPAAVPRAGRRSVRRREGGRPWRRRLREGREDFRCAHEVVNIARQTLRAVRIVCGEGSPTVGCQRVASCVIALTVNPGDLCSGAANKSSASSAILGATRRRLGTKREVKMKMKTLISAIGLLVIQNIARYGGRPDS